MTGDTITPELWMTPEPEPIRGATMVGYGIEGVGGERAEGEDLSWDCRGERRGEAWPTEL